MTHVEDGIRSKRLAKFVILWRGDCHYLVTRYMSQLNYKHADGSLAVVSQCLSIRYEVNHEFDVQLPP